MASITFSLTQLRAALACAAKSDIRYYLNGILVESGPKSTRMVATTGHYLLAVDYQHNEDNTYIGSFIIPREVCEMIAKGKYALDFGSIEVTESAPAFAKTASFASGTVHVQDTHVGFKSVEGHFPDYARVISSWVGNHDDMKAAQFNPEYIGVFAKVAKLFGSKLGQFVLWQRGDDSALVSFQSLPDRINATGVLMPVRTFKPGYSPNLPCTSQFQTRLDAKKE